MGPKPHIAVCICTYKRPPLLKRLLDELRAQETGGLFDYSVVVVDNDREASARAVAEEFGRTSGVPTGYYVEETPNIAMARNRVVGEAKGDFLAFIDDDEFPQKDWLFQFYKTLSERKVAGVLGPVLPHYDVQPPAWVKKGKFYDRRRHETGFMLTWQEARTGNVMIRSDIIAEEKPVFRPQFGAGGEDQDFFRRMIERGHQFIWCDEAPAYETVPPHRWNLRFLIERALLRGAIVCRHPKNRLRNVGKSLLAVPL
ncbi:MAG TPA: glycosyltransferase family A protein, partial [Candidatus Dormibacteraeota bacterium]|nr:glycosyltransferase family A protein [Candidatus Dormibacteraeota bacterium]